MPVPPWGVEEEYNEQLSISSSQLTVAPNPFTHNTVVEFGVHSSEFVDKKPLTLQIHDLAGRLVKSFPFNHLTIEPFNRIEWDGRDNTGEQVKPGIYFLRAPGCESVKAIRTGGVK
jgi:flagellar hook assembly protein FlgD